MLWKCYMKYASKLGKLISGHRTGKHQFSFQSQRKTMPKNVQTAPQLHSFHMLAKYYWKFSKLGFKSMWIENSQMFKLDLEKAEEPEIKLPISARSQKKQENSRNKQTIQNVCFIDYLKAFDCVDHNKLWKILQEMGIFYHFTCLLWNLYAGQEATFRTGKGTVDWCHIEKEVRQGCILSPCLFNL